MKTNQTRIINNGYFRFKEGCAKGMLVPIASSVERLEIIDGKEIWVLVGRVHPDDAQSLSNNLLK